MARKRNGGSGSDVETVDFRHAGAKRKNIPPAKIAAEGKVPRVPKARYHYSPHLPPVLRCDPTGDADRLPELVAEAGRRPLRPEEQRLIADALRNQEPWLEWATKREQHERGLFEVDPVALHIHERVSAQAIVRVAMREDVQRDLFADPQQPYQEAVQFYKHDMDWANRLILGDSLQVMSSLARRENLGGKVQMIYMDPPYGIRFASNFQSEVGKRDVKEKEQDLTREAEMVRAYRDTWTLGVHSYLSYLRDRILVARELLSDKGSFFLQISTEHLHRARALLDEVFGHDNFVEMIAVQKTGGLAQSLLPSTADYLLWYARSKSDVKFRQLYLEKAQGEGSTYQYVELPSGERRRMTVTELADPQSLPAGARVFQPTSLESANPRFPFTYGGREYHQRWKTNPAGLGRLADAGRIYVSTSTLRYVRYVEDFPVVPVTNVWTDTGSGSFLDAPLYVVQTVTKVIQRCLLMTTDPGDLVLDPTLGSGTTAAVAEQWGRRWIGIDTSRVAVAISRQRICTARFDAYRSREEEDVAVGSVNPRGGFVNKAVPHVTLKSIAQSNNLEQVAQAHEPILAKKLAACNRVLALATTEIRQRMRTRLVEKSQRQGKRSISDADRRRWELPTKFEHWNLPFDSDPDWPRELQEAVLAYRKAWRTKMDEITASIAANAEQEELVDQPEVVKGVVRVSGPFTVEGVRPEELSLGEEGLFDPTPNEFEESTPALQNLNAYLTRMVQLLGQDGVTFLNNQHRRFARIEPLFEQSTGTLIHAEGVWEGADDTRHNTVAIGFGPQYGPVTALQVEELVRAAKRYDELVIAGFSFDAAGCATIQEAQHPKLRIHQAYIRPDVNPGMDGLLKDTGNSQIFTVFGQPDVAVRTTKTGEYEVELKGVDIYDPVQNVIRSSGADKVAAWFLDGDFDGRCFCVTQAFFPDRDAWEKIAKALKSAANEEAFARLSGTVSLPFPEGKFKRIAVKVIDPRGNEVMAIRPLSI